MDCNDTVGLQWILVGMDCNGFLKAWVQWIPLGIALWVVQLECWIPQGMDAKDTCRYRGVWGEIGYLKVWIAMRQCVCNGYW